MGLNKLAIERNLKSGTNILFMADRRLIIFLVLAVFLVACAKTTTQIDTQQQIPQPAQTAAQQSAPAASSSSQITIDNFQFTPGEVTVAVNGTVTWTNNQIGVTHTVIIDGLKSSSNLQKGDSFEYVFTKAGTYNYHCGIHPAMMGTVVVK